MSSANHLGDLPMTQVQMSECPWPNRPRQAQIGEEERGRRESYVSQDQTKRQARRTQNCGQEKGSRDREGRVAQMEHLVNSAKERRRRPAGTKQNHSTQDFPTRNRPTTVENQAQTKGQRAREIEQGQAQQTGRRTRQKTRRKQQFRNHRSRTVAAVAAGTGGTHIAVAADAADGTHIVAGTAAAGSIAAAAADIVAAAAGIVAVAAVVVGVAGINETGAAGIAVELFLRT